MCSLKTDAALLLFKPLTVEDVIELSGLAPLLSAEERREVGGRHDRPAGMGERPMTAATVLLVGPRSIGPTTTLRPKWRDGKICRQHLVINTALRSDSAGSSPDL